MADYGNQYTHITTRCAHGNCTHRVTIAGRTMCAEHHYYHKHHDPAPIAVCRGCDKRVRGRLAQDRGECSRCYKNREAREASRSREPILTVGYAPDDRLIRLSESVRDAAERVARDNGHDVAVMPDADPGTWIGVCMDCLGYLVVDLIESPDPYGFTQRETCPKRPITPAARRRSEFDLDAATVSASGEWAEMKELDQR